LVEAKKLLKDRYLGAVFLSLALLGMVAYFWLVFLAPQDAVFLGKTVAQWSVLVPVIVIVYVFLFLVAWIGWALVSTAPPLPVPIENCDA
jgi:hypothetical protein